MFVSQWTELMFHTQRILHEWSFQMKFIKQAFGEFHKFLNWDLITFKINNLSIRKHTADMDVVNDITHLCQSVITHVVLGFL